jgi:hypothetical protein
MGNQKSGLQIAIRIPLRGLRILIVVATGRSNVKLSTIELIGMGEMWLSYYYMNVGGPTPMISIKLLYDDPGTTIKNLYYRLKFANQGLTIPKLSTRD